MKLRFIYLKILGLCLFFMIVAGSFLYCKSINTNSDQGREKDYISQSVKTKFRGFKTNLNKRSIDLDLILDGGPGKDGIPAINNPRFVSISETKIKDDVLGVLVDIKGKKRYYPYNILVWHEIVNDSLNGMDIVVTFCPLCGSAIVFNANLNGEKLLFGVSGKLYESNMLMYDKRTESLWSQSRAEAVVGDYTGKKLELVPMQLMRFSELKTKYPETQILSEKTGYFRDYSLYPYGDYDSNEQLYFPVSVQDTRFQAKEIMYVFNLYDKSVAFPADKLGETRVEKIIEGKTVAVERQGGEINVYVDGKLLPGYYEMWFSWATHHQKNGIVWKMK
ncbi:MAG: DUF3179 domain-containing protein [Candidatus Aminicenantes bacterium]|nr:DUF3179 domain-containing protein [Candidatus Aminicenantes bacterium]